jgi:enamine deaminase RidA (YjgF/YER057c/UK114 family)
MRTVRFALFIMLATFGAGEAAAQQPATPDKQRAEGVIASIGYANAIQVGNTVYVSGVVARGATVEEQLVGIYAGIKRALEPFGATLQDIVKETAYTTDMEALKAANEKRKAAYAGHSPAATWVQISRLFMESAKLEIEVIAVPGSGTR